MWILNITFSLNPNIMSLLTFNITFIFHICFSFKLIPNVFFFTVLLTEKKKISMYKIQYYYLKMKCCPESEQPWWRFALSEYNFFTFYFHNVDT